jgi:cytochrome c oxidase subunit 2
VSIPPVLQPDRTDDTSDTVPDTRSARAPSRTIAGAFVTTLLLGLAVAACGDDDSADLSPAAAEGRRVANANGCAACHGSDGQGGAGPSWQGLFGSEVELDDGSVVVADEAYLRKSIVDPAAQVTAGYQLRMPDNDLDDDEVDAVITYIRELRGDAGAATSTDAG